MTDITVIQKGDLDTKSFKNTNTNAQGGISIAISPDAGNLIGLRKSMNWKAGVTADTVTPAFFSGITPTRAKIILS